MPHISFLLKNYRHHITPFFWTFLSLILLANAVSCARKGRPGGGPDDITPPVLLRAVPDTFSTNIPVTQKTIEIDFDEFVVLKDHQKNVIISPPLDPPPAFSPSGIASKTVKIELFDTLMPETTYTINFGNSIQDNNAGNPYPFFTYVFSTGDYIDSLQVKGKINHTGERKMPENVIAALYKVDDNYHDSIIYTQKPYYVARIDSAQNFTLNYLHEGDYKLVAFNDETPNMQFDLRTEKLAFHPETVQAGSPENYTLNLFTPAKTYRAVEAVQADYAKLNFIFEGNPESVEIIPINHEFTTEFFHHRLFSDTLTMYFDPGKDTIMERSKRLRFAVSHLGITDTIAAVTYDNAKYTALNVYGRSIDYTPGMNYQIEANYPLDTLYKEFITVKKDTLDLDFEVERLRPNRFALRFPVEFESAYRIDMLPGAAVDFLDRTNDSLNFRFSVQSTRDYGNLILTLRNTPPTPYWLKLFDSQDKEVRSIYGQETNFRFNALKPGDYYFKLIVDENANQRYDTGDLFESRQPEAVYIYPANVTVRAFWDIEEVWIIGSDPTTTENSPDTTEPQRRAVEDLQPNRPLQE